MFFDKYIFLFVKKIVEMCPTQNVFISIKGDVVFLVKKSIVQYSDELSHKIAFN